MAKKMIGKVVNTFGLKGQIKVTSTTNHPEKRFDVGKKILIKNKMNEEETYVISSVIVKNAKCYYLGLEGFNDINEVEWMKGREVYANIRLPKGEFFFDDLVGMTIIDSDGVEVGKVETINTMPGGIYLICEGHFIPFKLDLFTESVDKDEKKIYLTELGSETLK